MAVLRSNTRFNGVPTENSRALHAARCASVKVLRSYSRMLHPNWNWFKVRIFTERFGDELNTRAA